MPIVMLRLTKAVRVILASTAIFGLVVVPAPALDTQLRLGDNRLQVEIGDWAFEFFTYRPLNCADPSVMVVFHGNGRGAQTYRNSARKFADEACFVIYSPYYDRERFPNWSYHRGGLIQGGVLRSDDEWTVSTAQLIVDWIKSREGLDKPIYMFGHSAGAQFLSRVVAYARPEGVARFVLANPSTYVVPSVDWEAPYGFGGLPPTLFDGSEIRRYLEAPLTIYLGLEDVGSEDLTSNEFADRQGANRLDRGRRTFQNAYEVAKRRGWMYGWSLVEVPGVGHTARGMLNASELAVALGLVDSN